MKAVYRSILAFVLLTNLSAGEDIAGEWAGNIEMGVAKLRVEFTFTRTDGMLTGAMKSPDQSDQTIPVKSVTISDGELVVSVPAILGQYVGKVEAGGKTITGKWKQAGAEFPLILKPEKPRTAASRPQHPQPPFPYTSKNVTFENKTAGVSLAGTLTIPGGGGPFPAAILISGSGPQDRDETLMGHKPFAVIADHLTRQGIAVLRYDDRGVGDSKGVFAEATTLDFATDANAAWNYLRKAEKIDPRKIGMIGHSEGGIVAPLAFKTNPEIAFQVLLAAPGETLPEIAKKQSEVILKQAGLSEGAIEAARKLDVKVKAIYERVGDNPVPAKEVEALMDQWWEGLSDTDKEIAEPFRGLQKSNLKQLNSPWTRFLLSYDPIPALRGVTCPVLALNGEKDIQVLPGPNLRKIEEALREAGNQAVVIRKLPNLNHLFQNCRTGAITEYADIEETFDPPTLKLISDWILSVVKQ